MAIVTRLERKSRRWEQVWSGDGEAVATIVAGRLDAEGIRARVHGSMTPYRTAGFALGGTWAILVPAGKAARAREVLRDNDEGQNVVEAEDGTGLTANQKSTIRFAILFGMAMVVILLLATLKGGL
ncbi:MAG: hypothetical protein ABI577_04220 [bacterium]